MKSVNIIQYNCGNANGRSARPFLDSINPTRFPVVAIQEPMVMEGQQGTTYCPRNFRLSRQLRPGARVVFFIHDKIPRTDCEVIAATDYCEKVRIKLGDIQLYLINVYIPPQKEGRTQERWIEAWPDIRDTLQPPEPNTLVIGDFNAHHEEWAGPMVRSEPKSEHLWANMRARNLQLLNEKGAITWRRGLQESVIDLGFATLDIADRIMTYRPRDDWAITKDHIPMEI